MCRFEKGVRDYAIFLWAPFPVLFISIFFSLIRLDWIWVDSGSDPPRKKRIRPLRKKWIRIRPDKSIVPLVVFILDGNSEMVAHV